MASLPSGIQTYSSTIAEVAQVTQPNPTMELSTAAKDVIIPSAHPSGSWISFKEDNYTSFAGFQSQPPSHPHNTDHVFHLLSNTQQSSNPSYPSASPVWRFYSMAAKGLGSKRVQDVKMNRIDKHRAGRKRRACRRPFVFKSSPLAEGQGAGRFTHFRANTFSQPSELGSSPLVCKRSDAINLHQSTFSNGQERAHIKHFLNHTKSAIQHCLGDQRFEKPVSFSSINRNSNSNILISNYRQPQISRHSNPKSTSIKPSSQNTNLYQSWEISLPTCALPKMGMFSN